MLTAARAALGSINARTLQTITDATETELRGNFSSVTSFDAFDVVDDRLGVTTQARPLSCLENISVFGSGNRAVLVVYVDCHSALHAPAAEVFSGTIFQVKTLRNRRLVIAIDWDVEAAVDYCSTRSFELAGVIVVGHSVFEFLEFQDALVVVPSVRTSQGEL